MLSADELNRQGCELFARGDSDGARLHYLAALDVDFSWAPALANLASLALASGNLVSGVSYLRRVLALAPNDGNQWNNLGNALTRLDRYDEAEVALQRAAELCPESSGVWHNRALLAHRQRKITDARKHLVKVKALGSRGHQVQNDEAHFILFEGKLHEGLIAYEARWHTLSHLPPWDFHIPEWQGEDLRGKSILLHAEQGHGDTIMCARFARDLRLIGASVTLGLPKSMCGLFETQPWVHSTLALEDMTETNMNFQFQSPMYGAMRWLGLETCDIDPRPYIHLTPKTRLLSSSTFNVGICWASGKRNTEADWRRRETDLSLWLPMAEIPGICLYSLQVGENESDVERLGAEGLVRRPPFPLNSWLDTANFIAALDLVICVDTAVAHLAGAMGRPTVMLSQFTHCWRWWNIERGSGEPWYKNMTIISQPSPGNWKTPLQVVAENLRRRLANDLRIAA